MRAKKLSGLDTRLYLMARQAAGSSNRAKHRLEAKQKAQGSVIGQMGKKTSFLHYNLIDLPGFRGCATL